MLLLQRNEGELAHRELMSQQKVLDDFGKEIFRHCSSGSSGSANSQLAEQYRKAESLFPSLISLSKVHQSLYYFWRNL